MKKTPKPAKPKIKDLDPKKSADVKGGLTPHHLITNK